jgi:hypothetical protein
MHRLRGAQFILAFVILWQTTAPASDLDTIGVTLLRAVTTNINGTGICVGQAEAHSVANPPYDFEVDPTNNVVEQPVGLFTYYYSASPYSTVSTATTFTNSLGLDSGHADAVAGNFYGMSGGVATNVAHVDNYEANGFINYYISHSHLISDRVVNQSFTEGAINTAVDQACDTYAASNGVLFVNGAGFNATNVWSPATSYNGIGVGVSDAPNPPPPYGPTPDGRSKPDLVTPGQYSSYTTPYVSGAAALLMQAALRGDGGSDTNSAVDSRTVKALLLNGAVKPAGWTNVVWNGTRLVLDTNYGAGVLNVFNSYKQLAGGKHGYIVATTVIPLNNPHPPTGAPGTVGVLSGWDFNTNTSSASADGVNHYYFNVTNAVSNATFTATATLVWNRHSSQTSINNLNLFLYNAANSNLVANSTSLVDNVEHIWLPHLAQGRYDLQVFKSGGSTVSASEPYSLAFEFFSMSLNVAKSGTNVVLKWPVYPTGFILESTTNLISPILWSTNNPVPVVTNNQNYVVLSVTNRHQFFRLWRP